MWDFKTAEVVSRSSNLANSQWWQMALEHLKDQWPRKMEGMLRAGTLREHLDGATRRAYRMQRAAEAKGLDPQDFGLQELMAREVCPRNPNHDPDNPKEMSPEGAKLLEEWEKKVEEEPD